MRWTPLAAGALCAALLSTFTSTATGHPRPGPENVRAHLEASSHALGAGARLLAAGRSSRARRPLRAAARQLDAAGRDAVALGPSVAGAGAARAVAARGGAGGRRLLRLLPSAPAGLQTELARGVRDDARLQARLARRVGAVVASLGRAEAERAIRAGRAIAAERRALGRAIAAALNRPRLAPRARRDLRAAMAIAARTIAALSVRPLSRSRDAAPERVASPPVEPVVLRDLPYAEVAGPDGPRVLLLDAYLPAASSSPPGPAVVVIHGGAWRGGGRALVAAQARAFAERGMAAFSIEYRRDARDVFQDQVADARAAVRWVRANAAAYGVDPARIGAFGSSAGGNLALLLGVRGEGPFDAGDRVAAVAAWSAPTDLPALATDTGPSDGCSVTTLLALGRCNLFAMVAASVAVEVLGCPAGPGSPWWEPLPRPAPCPERYAAGSPILDATPDDPPVLLAHAEADPLVPVRQAHGMTSALVAAGVEHEELRVPGDAHADALHDAVIGRTADFLAAHLARAGA
jgi:acetyl esterase/lipase